MAQAERRSSPNDAEADLGEPPAKKQKGSQEGASSGVSHDTSCERWGLS